jgi:hypothetical protein
MSKAWPGTPSGCWLVAVFLVVQLSGCTAGRVIPVGSFRSLEPPLKTIALAPSGAIFADLIGVALSEQGYTIIDSGATLALLVLMQQSADDLLSPQVSGMLKERGVDAVLVVQKVAAEDGLPQIVHVRLYSTDQMAEVGGIDWKNSWSRRSVWEAAQEIATAMAQSSRPADGPLDGGDRGNSRAQH